MRIPTICLAPQYVVEDLLRAEGFTDVHYVDAPSSAGFNDAIASGAGNSRGPFAEAPVSSVLRRNLSLRSCCARRAIPTSAMFYPTTWLRRLPGVWRSRLLTRCRLNLTHQDRCRRT